MEAVTREAILNLYHQNKAQVLASKIATEVNLIAQRAANARITAPRLSGIA